MPPKHRLLCLALMAIAALTAPGSVQSAAAQAHLTGQWTTLSTLMPINPIHTAVLRTGKVLVVAGSENDATITTYRVAVFDPATGGTSVQSVPWDLFCNGLVVLARRPRPRRGRDAAIRPVPRAEDDDHLRSAHRKADPGAGHGTWPLVSDEHHAGRRGHDDVLGPVGDRPTNRAVEVYDVPSGWSREFIAHVDTATVSVAPPAAGWARVRLWAQHRLPHLRSRQADVESPDDFKAWTLNVARTNYTRKRTFGSSVLLPLLPERSYQPRVMILGGDNPATASTEVIDLSQTAPSWRSAAADVRAAHRDECR